MKSWYNRYKDYIVIVLIGLCMFKTCQSCSRERYNTYNELKYTNIIDSLNNQLVNTQSKADSLEGDIRMYEGEIQMMKDMISQYKDANKMLRDDNIHYRNANKVLVNTNKQIINKD
jgi:uncharacterized protein YllA (UPF0747 family)